MPFSACSSSAFCEDPPSASSWKATGSPNLCTFSLVSIGRADFVWWSCKVGVNLSVGVVCFTDVIVIAVIVVVPAAESVNGEDVDRYVPDTNDKLVETVEDGCDSVANICVTLSTLSASWCEAFTSESSFPALVSGP